MFNKIFHLPKDASLQARNAFRITLIGLPAASVAASFYLYLGLTNGAWQLYAWSADIWLLALVLLISIILIRRDRMSSGVWLFLIAISTTFIAAVALIEGIGLLVGASIAILLSVIASQTLSGKAINRANVLGVVSGVAAVLLDLFGPSYRLPQPEPIRVFLPGILGVVILLYGFMAIRQFGNYSLRTKLLLGFVGILVLAGLFGVFAIRQQFQAAEQTAITEASHVAETLGAVAAKNQADLQELVLQLHETQQRDVEVLGPDKRILADAVPEDIGTIFVHDQNGEVTATLQDGTPRTFVEVSPEYPQGIQQVVMPIRDEASGAITGAVILEYTQILYQTTVAEIERFAGKASEIIASNPAGLQDYTAAIFLSRDQSAVVVDLHKQILADSIPENVGKLFMDDTNGEVTATLKDGTPRTFVEFSVDYPQGIQQVVASIKDSSGKIIGAAILEPSSASEETAIGQAFQVAEAISASASQNQARVQELIDTLHESQQRDAKVVGLDMKILADAVPEGVGTIFDADQNGEVAATLEDGQPRTFVEISPDYPQGVKQVVVPVKDQTGKITAAIVMDYTSLYEELQHATNTTTRTLIFLGMAGLLLAFVISQVISNSVSRPITQLSEVAQKIGSGQLDTPLPAFSSKDEIGALGGAFSSMTAQLRNTLAGLEQRVAERTHSLELAAEVGRSVSQVRSLDVMLKDAAEIIRAQFDLYYVQVYLTNPSQTTLLLQSGTGAVGAELLGRAHQLPLNSASINGRAAIEKKSVVISDTADSPTFKPNPMLPDTRSEMAVPLLIGDRVVGVLDMQSEHAGSLSQDVLPAFEALAGQLAIAIQNATLLAETEQARAEVEAQAQRLSRANWMDYLDAIHKPEETGFVFEQNKVMPMAQEEQPRPASENALTAPIAVTGEAIGNLVVEMEGQSPIARTDELVNTVARQVAQQIESLRLLDSAERYRFEAEEASRRLTREGWKDYMQANADEGMSYMYDLKEVRPYHSNGAQPSEESAFSLPLKVRDETVGKLSVLGLNSGDKESLDLVDAVAERLGAHIESLRQFDETKRGQIELDKRAQQLAAVAEISSVSSRELDIQKMLESVVYLTQRKFRLYHAHVFTYNENTEELKIAACGWKEGDEHEGTHGTAHIPLAQEQSLVARAARTRQAVIVNDVHNEPGWLPNPLLPDTASELAVPLVIGDQILGVLDVQSDRLNAFTEEDANIQTTLASQVATALQNARSFVKAQQQAERESTLNVISQKIQSATSVESVLQIAARELGRALGAPLTIAQLGIKENNGNGGNGR